PTTTTAVTTPPPSSTTESSPVHEITTSQQITPVQAAVGYSSADVDRLTKHVISLYESGEAGETLFRLEEITGHIQADAEMLGEMALLYEVTQQLNRSDEIWGKIKTIGPAAGALYDLAVMGRASRPKIAAKAV